MTTSQADQLIGGSAWRGSIHEIDKATGRLSSPVHIPPTRYSGGRTVYSLARHPDTGEYYAVMDRYPSRLVTIDPTNGDVSDGVVITGGAQSLTTITFGPGPDYPLYGLTGSRGGQIYMIDPVTGQSAMTDLPVAGIDGGGHSLEYNPDDGLLYHFYSSGEGGQDPDVLVSIDPDTGQETPIPLSQNYGAANGIAYGGPGSGFFYIMDRNNSRLYKVETDGTVTALGSTSYSEKAIELAPGGTNLLVARRYDIIEIDPMTGGWVGSQSYGTVPYRRGIFSMARDHGTNDYYIVAEGDDRSRDNRILAVVDLETGEFSNRVDLSDSGVSGITVGPGGVIYGVNGGRGIFRRGAIVMIDKTNGQMTDTLWASSDGRGHSLEYNPDDGCLYHFYSHNNHNREAMEKIDVATGDITQIGFLSGLNEPINGVVYAGNNVFYGVNRYRDVLYRITASAEWTALAGLFDIGYYYDDVDFRALELIPEPGVSVPAVVDRTILRRKIKALRKEIRELRRRKSSFHKKLTRRVLKKRKRVLQNRIMVLKMRLA